MKFLFIGSILLSTLGVTSYFASDNNIKKSTNYKKMSKEVTPYVLCWREYNEITGEIETRCGNRPPVEETPTPDLSSLEKPIAKEWLNNINYENSIGSIYPNNNENVKLQLYISPNYKESARIYTQDLTGFSPAKMINLSKEHTFSFGTSATVSRESELSLSAETDVYFAKVAAEATESLGFSISSNLQWTCNEIISIDFSNTRYLVDENGNITNYIAMKIIAYSILIPIKVVQYSKINNTYYHTSTYYITANVRHGTTIVWDDGKCISWYSSNGIIPTSEFYKPFEKTPASIQQLFNMI